MEANIDILQNKVDCINKVHTCINTEISAIIKELKKGFQITTENKFFQKDVARFKGALCSGKFHYNYISIDQYDIKLKVCGWYIVSEYGCYYYDKNVHILNRGDNTYYNIESYPEITKQQLIDAETEKEQLQDQISKLKTKISTLDVFLGE